MRHTILFIILATLLCSCHQSENENKAPHTWVYRDEKPITKITYEVNGPVLKQQFHYDTTTEYFEIDLVTKRGIYHHQSPYDSDSLLTVERVMLNFLPRQLEIYKVSFGRSDHITDNEFDVYLERTLGIFFIQPVFDRKGWRNLRKNN